MIRYKIDVIAELQKRGYTSTKLIHDKIIPSQTYFNIRDGKKAITTDTLNKMCLLLRMQPGDILEEIPTDEEKIKYF